MVVFVSKDPILGNGNSFDKSLEIMDIRFSATKPFDSEWTVLTILSGLGAILTNSVCLAFLDPLKYEMRYLMQHRKSFILRWLKAVIYASNHPPENLSLGYHQI